VSCTSLMTVTAFYVICYISNSSDGKTTEFNFLRFINLAWGLKNLVADETNT
jgi:hypothetical protein